MRMRFYDTFFLAICFSLFLSKNYSQISNITDAGFDTTLLSVNWAAETPKVGHISKLRLVKIDLTNFDDLVTFCNVTDNMKNGDRLFKKCWGKLKEVRIFTSPKQEDMNRWTMRQNLPFFDKSSKFFKRKNDSFQFIIDSRGGVPELSKPYAPHLVAIEGAYVSKWGYIFDSKRLYNFGGCANKGWDEPNLEIDLWKFKVWGIHVISLHIYNLRKPFISGADFWWANTVLSTPVQQGILSWNDWNIRHPLHCEAYSGGHP